MGSEHGRGSLAHLDIETLRVNEAQVATLDGYMVSNIQGRSKWKAERWGIWHIRENAEGARRSLVGRRRTSQGGGEVATGAGDELRRGAQLADSSGPDQTNILPTPQLGHAAAAGRPPQSFSILTTSSQPPNVHPHSYLTHIIAQSHRKFDRLSSIKFFFLYLCCY